MKDETKSLWIATTGTPRFPPAPAGLHVDVAIIGAGITGLTAAVLLKERGKRVVVIEKDAIVTGESGHTTAHLTEAVDVRYHYLRRMFNKEAARMVADASRASIEKIDELATRYGISCRFERVPGYLYTEKRRYVAPLKNEAIAASESGVSARWVAEVPLPFPTRGAVLFENQAQFHPREYLLGLAQQIAGDGSFIVDDTHVESIDEGKPHTLHTSGGTITADIVFMATNVPIQGFQTLHMKDAAYRTYAIAYKVDKQPQTRGLFWDTADPYHYTRWQDTDEGTFMIVGGEDHKVGQEEDTEGCFQRLHQYVVEHFGALEPSYRWSGQVLEPVDGLPYIGGAANERMYVSTGYAGQGMTFGTVGGMLVADLITGVENPWAELFKPMRVHARGAVSDFISENKDFPKHLIEDRLLSRDVETTRTFDVKSGEGKIVEVDGRKMACYRDESGGLHAVSPICTHMRCDVAWNNSERSWDCPCHGSRFTPDGEVLNGPAKVPLEKFANPEG
jgi:glycine/D-amino acid oxidase-like deaminating enzyme/nitrite reductase/ring-hydroxylating ferredoxin subunit